MKIETCGRCEYHFSVWAPVCAQAKFGGYTQYGGISECILADSNYAAHVPIRSAARDTASVIPPRYRPTPSTSASP